MDHVGRIAAPFSEKVLMTWLRKAAGRQINPGRVELETRAWFNENLESRNFYVPGVISLVVMLVTLMLASMPSFAKKKSGRWSRSW